MNRLLGFDYVTTNAQQQNEWAETTIYFCQLMRVSLPRNDVEHYHLWQLEQLAYETLQFNRQRGR